jgi:hypothetical protein
MINFTEEQMIDAENTAYLKAGHNAYFGNGFKAGVEFALEQIGVEFALEQINKNVDKSNVIESFVCKHPYKDWDGMSEYCKCKTCGKRIKAN